MAGIWLLIEKEGVDEEGGASHEGDEVDNPKGVGLVAAMLPNSHEELVEYPFLIATVDYDLIVILLSHFQLSLS